MRSTISNNTRIDVWRAFTDFMTSALLILVLFVLGIFFTNIARELISAGNEINTVKANQRIVADKLAMIPGIEVQENGNLQRIILHVDKENKGGVLFDSGRAELKNEGKDILRKVVAVLTDSATYYKTVQVEGHTDDKPISTSQYRSNWELSAARAGAVVSYLLSQQNVLEPWRFSANGRGEFRPYNIPEAQMKIATLRKTSDEIAAGHSLPDYVVENNIGGKADLNRRIEIILIY